jgi:uncharacterized protein YndB with AHSA1/START domain
MANETKIEQQGAAKLVVTRTFNATKDKVWRAWTESALLDQWWAPKPWKAETKEMDFAEGGHWLYAMVGPEGEKHWARVDYKTIKAQDSFTATDAFCDEEGHISNDFPSMGWFNTFTDAGNSTDVKIEITFDSEESLNTIVEVGFKEGFSMGLGNLDGLLETL